MPMANINRFYKSRTTSPDTYGFLHFVRKTLRRLLTAWNGGLVLLVNLVLSNQIIALNLRGMFIVC